MAAQIPNYDVAKLPSSDNEATFHVNADYAWTYLATEMVPALNDAITDINGALYGSDTVIERLNVLDLPYGKGDLAQKLAANLNFGIGASEIYAGADRAPQGLAYVEVGGVKKVYALQRCAGSSYETSERHRIVEFTYADTGAVINHVAFSEALNVGHGQDLTAVVEGGELYFYCQGSTEPGHTGTDGGKAISRVLWRGSMTSQADVSRFQLFGYAGSGHEFERFSRATVGVSPDGKRLVLCANDDKGAVDDLGHNLFVYDLPELLAAADPLTVKPVAGPLPITPRPHNRMYILQGCAPGVDRIALLRGYTNPFEQKGVELYDYAGNLDQVVLFDGPRGDWTLAELMDHPTLGVPYSFEPEGVSWMGNELLAQFAVCWREVGDVVSWHGQNWACIGEAVTGRLPCEGDVWVKTNKPAGGAYDPSATYNRGASWTMKEKRVYRIGLARGEAGEQPLLNGSGNLLPVGQALGESGVDMSFRYGRDLGWLAYNEAAQFYTRAFGYFEQHAFKVFDQRDGSDNEDNSSIIANYLDGREIMELRASHGSMTAGAWANLYGAGDANRPGWFRLGGSKDGAGTFALEHDPVIDATRIHSPLANALYDSGWVAVAASSHYDFAHGLQAKFASHEFGPLDATDYVVSIWFKDGSGHVFQVPSGYTHSTSNEVGLTVYHKSGDTLQIATGNDGVYAYDNTELAGSVTLEVTGQIRVKIQVVK